MLTSTAQRRQSRGTRYKVPGQRGSLLITAVILIVIVSLLTAVIVSLFVSNSRSGADHMAASKALYLAESGLQRGTREWSLNPGTYAGEGPLTFGAGSFTVLPPDDFDFSGNPLPAGQKHITSTGSVPVAGGSAIRTIEAIVQSGALSGIVLSNNGFDLPGATCPPEPTDWNVTAPGNDCNNGVALGGGVTGLPGDTAVFSQKSGGGGSNTTTATQTLATLCTTSAGTTFTVTFDYNYLETPASGGANRGRINMRLRQTSGVWRQSGWFNVNNSTGGWISHPGVTISVPAGQSLDTFEAQIQTSGNVTKTLWIDNVVFTAGTCSGSTTQIIGWQEVVS